jgi:hypothetical protein
MERATRCFRQLAATADGNPNVAADYPCILKGVELTNAKAAKIYLKLYNYTGSAPLSSDTPIKTIEIPASARFVRDFPPGFVFAKGLAYRVTGAAADNDTTALLANDFTCLNIDMALQ